MLFRANPDVRVALTSGHTVVISDEWREIPAMFHSEAIALGAEFDKSSGKIVSAKIESSEEANNRPDSEDDVIRTAINIMVNREDPDDFTVDGNPKVPVVSKVAGMIVTKVDVMRVFREMQAEAEAAGEE